MAVELFKSCKNIEWQGTWDSPVDLYRWHEESERAKVAEEQPTEKSRESRLRREIADLKRLLAEKTLHMDFFKGALQKVEGPGEQAFTTTFGT